jgi:hypothetical protein
MGHRAPFDNLSWAVENQDVGVQAHHHPSLFRHMEGEDLRPEEVASEASQGIELASREPLLDPPIRVFRPDESDVPKELPKPQDILRGDRTVRVDNRGHLAVRPSQQASQAPDSHR